MINREAPRWLRHLSSKFRSVHKRGTNAAKQMRKKGLVPAVIYGHKEATAVARRSRRCAVQGDSPRRPHLRRDAQRSHPEGAVARDSVGPARARYFARRFLPRLGRRNDHPGRASIEVRGTRAGVTAAAACWCSRSTACHVECLIVNIPESIRVNVGRVADRSGDSREGSEVARRRQGQERSGSDHRAGEPEGRRGSASPAAAAPTAESAEPEVIGRVKDGRGRGSRGEEVTHLMRRKLAWRFSVRYAGMRIRGRVRE